MASERGEYSVHEGAYHERCGYRCRHTNARLWNSRPHLQRTLPAAPSIPAFRQPDASEMGGHEAELVRIRCQALGNWPKPQGAKNAADGSEVSPRCGLDAPSAKPHAVADTIAPMPSGAV